MSLSLPFSLHLVLYIYVSFFKMNKEVRDRREFLLQFQVGTTAGSDRRPPPLAAIISGGFFRRDQGSDRLEKRNPPLELAPPSDAPRAASSSHAFRRVQLTRRRAGVGSCPFRSRQLRRRLLGLFRASPPASGKPFGQLLCVFLSCVLGFAVWLLNGLLWTCFFILRDPRPFIFLVFFDVFLELTLVALHAFSFLGRCTIESHVAPPTEGQIVTVGDSTVDC